MNKITNRITTTHGLMDPALLKHREIVTENDDVRVVAQEYYLKDELVHRSVDVFMKRWPVAASAQPGQFNQPPRTQP